MIMRADLRRASAPAAPVQDDMDALECRQRADAYGLLAQKVSGEKRSELLNAADQWDDLAEQLDGESQASTAPASPAKATKRRPILHLPVVVT